MLKLNQRRADDGLGPMGHYPVLLHVSCYKFPCKTLIVASINSRTVSPTVPTPMTTGYPPEPWQVIHDLTSAIFRFSDVELSISSNMLEQKLIDFVNMISRDDIDFAESHVNMFTSSWAPEALVQLYLSPDQGIKQCAQQSIQIFINAIRFLSPESIRSQSVPIVLELCKLFRRYADAANDDYMYKFCRSNLLEMVKHSESFHACVHNRCLGVVRLKDTFPLAYELVTKVSEGLVLSMDPVNSSGPKASCVDNFRDFLMPLKALIKDRLTFPIRLPVTCNCAYLTNKMKCLYMLFEDLLAKMVMCLDTMEDLMKEKKENDGWNQYLMILKELHDISIMYEGAEECLWRNLRGNTLSLCYLIVRYAKRGEDYEWILKHKDVINFESRRCLVMLLLPEVNDGHEDLHEVFVDRSQLLVESFESIAYAEPSSLCAGLFVEFNNEEANGPGVLREWFFLLCQEIFNPKNGLFVACPNDCRRFFPNPASKVDPMHLEYYNFTGRIIALALMHEVQVGIAFDRSFLLQLAGNKVSLEDIKDADPFLYSSCNHILEMDPMEIDQDILGLKFVWEIQESGLMKVVELCPDGKNIIVNSRNRNEYVDLLIQYRFMTSISEQTTHFAQGFTDIVGEKRIQKICFRSLEVEDFDGMLYGSESDIDLQDWAQHTSFLGFLDADPMIDWFWEIVENMSAKQRKALLYFWTSINHLPVEGFSGLPSMLKIHKSHNFIHHLPSSNTCFYQLCIPAYPSMSVMQERIDIITQDHIGYSFGTN